jgi:hypothetical protein
MFQSKLKKSGSVMLTEDGVTFDEARLALLSLDYWRKVKAVSSVTLVREGLDSVVLEVDGKFRVGRSHSQMFEALDQLREAYVDAPWVGESSSDLVAQLHVLTIDDTLASAGEVCFFFGGKKKTK